MDGPCRILAVDDERRGVELVARALRKLGRVETALSGEEAWELVSKQDFDLVISDQRMPGISGVDLLERVAARNENMGRILLTGYADLDSTVDSINRGRVHCYLHKPCDPDALRSQASGVLERVSLARENLRLRSVVHEQEHQLEDARDELDAKRRDLDAVLGEHLGRIREIGVKLRQHRAPGHPGADEAAALLDEVAGLEALLEPR